MPTAAPPRCRSDLPVVFAARALPRPSREPDVVGDDVVVWSDGETVLAEHASGVRGRADAIRAEIGGEQSRVDLGFAFHRLFPILVTHLLGWRSRFVLHAGALVRDGSARLVLGGSGTGKSTSRPGRRAGRLDDARRRPVRTARIGRRDPGRRHRRPHGRSCRPRPGAGAPRPSPARRRARAGSEIDVEPGPGWHVVQGVVLTGHGSTPAGDLQEVGQATVWAMLLASFLASGSAPLLRRYFPLAGRLSRLPASRLSHSSDPAIRLRVAQGACSHS